MKPRGRKISLSLARKWIVDLMRISREIPAVSVERHFQLQELAAARAVCEKAPSWAGLFVKAVGIVANDMPQFRQCFVNFPWPHLYESPISRVSVAVSRDFQGESAVFFGAIVDPFGQSLDQLSRHLDDYKTLPVDEIRSFARLIRYTRYPLPIRRLLWRLGMSLSGKHRVKTFGTFGLTALGSVGVTLLDPLSPTAFTLTYGPIESGKVLVRLVFDHRVIDGMIAAQFLRNLEGVLNSQLRDECSQQRTSPSRESSFS